MISSLLHNGQIGTLKSGRGGAKDLYGQLLRPTPEITLWPLVKSQLTGKTLMLGKIEGKRRRGTTEDEMVGWHHPLNGH